ncbi:MAG: hypothetical protein HY694_05475 [Deltaproteobacteria bacterium]|nr:hypothetical protein [Deltaproteobacteria bacterium]
MAEVPKQIAELIAKFDQNLDAYDKDVIHEDAIKAGATKAPAFTILFKQIALTFV